MQEEFSILDKSMNIEGNVSFKGKMLIKGTLKGTLSGENLVIGEQGAVYAETKVGNVTIGGIFEGEIRALSQVIILSTGKCQGKIICQDLVIEPGGILNGKVTRIQMQGSGN